MVEPERRRCVSIALAVGALVVAACAPVEPPSAPGPTAARTEARDDTKAAPSPWPGYAVRGRDSSTRGLDLEGGLRLEIVDDDRVLFDRVTGIVRGIAPLPRGVSRVARVPQRLGGGFVLVGASGVHVVSNPLGEPVQRLVRAARDISFGGGALVSLQGGGQLRLDLATGAVSAPVPFGATAYALADDGLVAALVEGGTVHVSRDGGKSFEILPQPEGRAAVELTSVDGAIRMVDDALRTWTVEPTGLREAPARADQPPAGVDPRWTARESPLELAVKEGALLGGDRAVVAFRGSVFVIELSSGAIVQVETGLPPQSACSAVGLSTETLFACPDDGRLALFARPAKGGVRLERTFQLPGRLVRGGGDTLLFTGPCEGLKTDLGLACVREKANTWHPIDRSPAFAAKPSPSLLAWVPTATSAFALLGGAVVGVLDAKTGERTVLEGPEAQRFTQLVGSERREPVEHRFRWENGAIEGWAADGSHLRIEGGGKRVEVGGFRFPSARTAGSRALASGPDGQVWQSLDGGRTFAAIATPPTRVGSPQECGEAGCLFGRWIRAGWSTEPPAARAPVPSPPGIPDPPPPRVPVLSCATAGPQVRRAAGGSDTPMGLGAVTRREADLLVAYHAGPDDPMSRMAAAEQLLATEIGPPVGEGAGLGSLAATRNLRFVLPFEPTATIRSATVRLGDLVDATHAAGATPPTASELQGEGRALTILSPRGADAGLLLVRESGLAVWLGGTSPRALATTRPDMDLGTPIGAARVGDALAVLFADSRGDAHVVRMGAGRAEVVFGARVTRTPPSAPRSLDALAVDEKGGLAILRFPSRAPPGEASPAMVLRPGAGPTRLAPWSTLAVDGSPGCESPEGLRAIVSAGPPWIQLGPSIREQGQMTALVRWTERIVCLEAIETSGADLETPNGSVESRLVATWGKEPKAGLVVVDAGVELREPRTCSLLR